MSNILWEYVKVIVLVSACGIISECVHIMCNSDWECMIMCVHVCEHCGYVWVWVRACDVAEFMRMYENISVCELCLIIFMCVCVRW